MLHRGKWTIGIVLVLGLAVFIPVAHAQRQDFKSRQCSVTTYSVVHRSPEVTILSGDQKGILQSIHESKLFDNWTLHLVGVWKGIDGKWNWNGLMKEMAPDGEFVIWEFYGDSESKTTTAKPIYGSGKWKDIKGERKSRLITAGKPIVQGIDQFCQEQIGWIELPK
jgi:hypothetical protein